MKLRVNPLNAELNPTCHLLAFLGAHHIFHVSGLRVKYCTTGEWFEFRMSVSHKLNYF